MVWTTSSFAGIEVLLGDGDVDREAEVTDEADEHSSAEPSVVLRISSLDV